MALTTRVVDQAVWDDLVELFGPSGGTRGYRGQGLTLPMIDAAVEYARSSGARIVEAYPVRAMPGDPGRGVLSTFRAAGFTPYAEDRTTTKRNVIVRRDL
jgi:hypothetical protein